ncbi:MAG: hypothetical protein HKN00_05975 [Flavobacteriaceae bacterium]|nr:hypothetical protein [Bacteroidia bacterium]MBT8287195.1 hypothetical protein [Bacteroidia bacterium]NNF74712.1 hypothetical protein [Flavobacteriaceae bacterium]NNK71875.1 hypothetical protein [Flavobacteriaceae bacterium]
MNSRTLIRGFGKVLLLLLLGFLLLFAFLYFYHREDLPTGIAGESADMLANKMLDALDHEAFEATTYLEWTFRNRNHYRWNREKATCDVVWKDFKVVLSLDQKRQDKAYIHNFEVYDEQADELISKARRVFNNDSFWLTAPYKVFDSGVVRQLVEQPNGDQGLLVTYTKGGTTPGDSYLWLLKDSGEPYAFKMWVSVIPIPGLQASWDSWITTQSGARLPDKHKLLFLTLDMGEVKGLK